MIDFIPTLISAFKNKGINIVHADAADSNATVPCYTYRESGNSDSAVGDTVGYSDLQYTIEVWGRNYSEFIADCTKVDKIMHELKFYRVGITEQSYQGLYRKIMIYDSLKKEKY